MQPNGIKLTPLTTSEGDAGWVWDILIPGLTNNAKVTINEINYGLPGQEHSATVNGTPGTSLTNVAVDPDIVVQGVHVDEIIRRNNVKEFDVWDYGEDTAKIFMARLTSSEALVISSKKLDLSERMKVEAALKTMSEAGDWTFGKPVLYYSFEDARDGKIDVRGYNVTYNETTHQIEFKKTMQWTHTGTATITYKPGRPSDFNFVNSYTERGVGIDIIKVDKNKRTIKIPNAEFTITKLDLNSTSNNILPAYKEVNGKNEFEYQETKLTDAQGKDSFTNLTSGCYEIKETKAPSGYIKEEDVCIYVKVVDGVALYLQKSDDTTVTIGNWTAISQTSNTDLIHLETLGVADDPSTPEDETVPTALSVGNTPGAELPHTGGPGTYLIYLFGILLMAFAGAGFVMKRRVKNTLY